MTRLESYLAERGRKLTKAAPSAHAPCPLAVDAAPEVEHVKWVQGLPAREIERARIWLDDIARAVVTGLQAG